MSNASPHEDRPLALTVHSQPTPHAIAQANANRAWSGRWKMLVVALVCAAPVVASYFTYYVVRPQARKVYGALIDPQRPLPDVRATSLEGKPVALPSLKGQWLLISVAAAACDALCAEHLYLQRQLREGLGKDKERLDWVWLVDDVQAVPDALRPALKDAVVLRLAQADVRAWLQSEPGAALQDHLYLVDPLGNWMMRFPARLQRADAPKVKRDLERLLRASASWDQPGR